MLQDHFADCLACEQELHSTRRLKALLRGLRDPAQPSDFSRTFSRTLARRLEQTEAQEWRMFSLPTLVRPVIFLSPTKPQRGRRLATALALSCLTLLSLVAPFAPEGHDSPRTVSSVFGSSLGDRGLPFASPASLDPVFSGPMPERMTIWNDLSGSTRLPVMLPRPLPSQTDMLTLTVLPPSPLPTAMDTEAHPQTIPDSSAQSAVFRLR